MAEMHMYSLLLYFMLRAFKVTCVITPPGGVFLLVDVVFSDVLLFFLPPLAQVTCF